MSILIIVLSGALGGFMSPSITGLRVTSHLVNLTLGILGGALGGMGVLAAFSIGHTFNGLFLLVSLSFFYGVLMVLAIGLIRSLMRQRQGQSGPDASSPNTSSME